VIIDTVETDTHKTKVLAVFAEGDGLRVPAGDRRRDRNENFARAARNIPLVDVLPSQGANVYDIIRRNTLVLTKSAVIDLEARLK